MPKQPSPSRPAPLADLVVERPVAIRRTVYDSLREELLSGRLAAGSRLVEGQLAERIGVSRTPIREALHLLEREGLVEPIPRGGYRVKTVSWAEVEEICEIRALNEGLAARWAIARMGAEDLRALEECVARSEAEARAGQTRHFADRDAEFHELLARASGSARLAELCQTLRRHMLLYRVESLRSPETVRLAVAGHRRLLDRLRHRDVPGAEAAIRQHLA
ncbi:MAG: GntR family transcriptional regulator, partial [Deferrisomatales bacterium]